MEGIVWNGPEKMSAGPGKVKVRPVATGNRTPGVVSDNLRFYTGLRRTGHIEMTPYIGIQGSGGITRVAGGAAA